jgi:uncharacterized protein with HEPN domain
LTSLEAGRLDDMLRKAQLALAFVQGFSAEDFSRDEKTYFAVVRCLEIIGEAATHISAETRSELSSIPWSDIIRQRHLAIHHYDKLEAPRIWITTTRDLPPLIAALQTYLEEHG